MVEYYRFFNEWPKRDPIQCFNVVLTYVNILLCVLQLPAHPRDHSSVIAAKAFRGSVGWQPVFKRFITAQELEHVVGCDTAGQHYWGDRNVFYSCPEKSFLQLTLDLIKGAELKRGTEVTDFLKAQLFLFYFLECFVSFRLSIETSFEPSFGTSIWHRQISVKEFWHWNFLQ